MSNATSSRRGFLRSSLGAAVIAVAAPFVMLGSVGSDPLGGGPTNSTGEPGDIPSQLFLSQNYPNPFNPSTTIRYTLPARSTVELAVFSVDGRLVRVLESGTKSMGTHEATWDGRDSHGALVASGVYLYRLKAGSFSETRKMVLMK